MKDHFLRSEIDSSLISFAKSGPETVVGPLTLLAAPRLGENIGPDQCRHIFNHPQPVVKLIQGFKELYWTIIARLLKCENQIVSYNNNPIVCAGADR